MITEFGFLVIEGLIGVFKSILPTVTKLPFIETSTITSIVGYITKGFSYIPFASHLVLLITLFFFVEGLIIFYNITHSLVRFIRG